MIYCNDTEGEKRTKLHLYEVVVSKYDIQQKYIIVKSDSKMALATKNSTKVVAKEDTLINRTINKPKKQYFYCEYDLKSAIKLAFENLKFHIIEEHTFESVAKYESKGRPKKDSQCCHVQPIPKNAPPKICLNALQPMLLMQLSSH